MPEDVYTKSALKIQRMIAQAMPVLDRNAKTRTQLDGTDLAAAVYATILPLLENDPALAAQFINTVIAKHPLVYERLFQHLFNLGYCAAVNDAVAKRIKISR